MDNQERLFETLEKGNFEVIKDKESDEKLKGQLNKLKYITDNFQDENGNFTWFWTWDGDEIIFEKEFNSKSLEEWKKLLKIKYRDFMTRDSGRNTEPYPQTLAKKSQDSYLLELQTYDYCGEGTQTFFDLDENEFLEYLNFVKEKGLYDINYSIVV